MGNIIKLKINLVVVFFMLNIVILSAQNEGQDFLRSTGKIYSVVAAIVIIFLGIAYYLWRLDQKITKLEKQIKDEQ